MDGQRRDSRGGGWGHGHAQARVLVLPELVGHRWRLRRQPWLPVLWLLALCLGPAFARATVIESPVLTVEPVPGGCQMPVPLAVTALSGAGKVGHADNGLQVSASGQDESWFGNRGMGRGEAGPITGPSGPPPGVLPVQAASSPAPVTSAGSASLPAVLAASPFALSLENAQSSAAQALLAPGTRDFLAQDAQISWWIRLKDVRVGDTLTYRWFDPNGRLYHRHTLERSEDAETSCSWSTLHLSGMPASSRLGLWRVELSYNGATQLTETFRIAQSGRIFAPTLEQSTTDWLPAFKPLLNQSFVPTLGPVLVSLVITDLKPGDVWEVRWQDPQGRRVGPLTGTIGPEQDPVARPGTRRLQFFWPGTLRGAAHEPSPFSPGASPGASQRLPSGDWTLEVWLNDIPRQAYHFWLLPEGPSTYEQGLLSYLGEGNGNPCTTATLNPLVPSLEPLELDLNPLADRLVRRGSGGYHDPERLTVQTVLASLDALLKGRETDAWRIARMVGMVWTRILDGPAREPYWVLEPEQLNQPRGFEALLVYRPAGDAGLIVEVARPVTEPMMATLGLALLKRGAGFLLMPGSDAAANHPLQERLTEPLCGLPYEAFARNPDLDDSDASLNENSLFHQLHEGLMTRALRRPTRMVVQLWGFSPQAQPELSSDAPSCDVDVVLAGGASLSDPDEALLEDLASRLSRYASQGERNGTRYQVYFSGEEPDEASSACAGVISALQSAHQAPSTLRGGGVWVALAVHERLRTGAVPARTPKIGNGGKSGATATLVEARAADTNGNIDAAQVSEAVWETWRALRVDAGDLPSPALRSSASSAASESVVSPSPNPALKAPVSTQDSPAASGRKGFR